MAQIMPKFHLAFGGALILQGAKPVRLAAGAFDNMVLSRLAASRSFTKGIHLYASRRGVLFYEEKYPKVI